jgi:hypothetical protein
MKITFFEEDRNHVLIKPYMVGRFEILNDALIRVLYYIERDNYLLMCIYEKDANKIGLYENLYHEFISYPLDMIIHVKTSSQTIEDMKESDPEILEALLKSEYLID